MSCAIYIQREDGDYDFVAAFAIDHLPEYPSDWPKEISDWFISQGEKVKMIEADLAELPDVLPGLKSERSVRKHDD